MFVILKLLFLAAAAVLAGYLFSDIYDEYKYPEPTVIGHGTVVAKSNYSDKLEVRAKRQVVRRASPSGRSRPPAVRGSTVAAIAPRPIAVK